MPKTPHCNCPMTFWVLEMFLLGVGDTWSHPLFFSVNQAMICGMWLEVKASIRLANVTTTLEIALDFQGTVNKHTAFRGGNIAPAKGLTRCLVKIKT